MHVFHLFRKPWFFRPCSFFIFLLAITDGYSAIIEKTDGSIILADIYKFFKTGDLTGQFQGVTWYGGSMMPSGYVKRIIENKWEYIQEYKFPPVYLTLSDERKIETAASLVSNQDFQTRMDAFRVLAQLHSLQGIPIMISLIGVPNAYGPMYLFGPLTTALLAYGKEAIPEFYAQYKETSSEGAKKCLLSLISEFGKSDQLFDLCAAALLSDMQDLRGHAALILGKVCDPRGIPLVIDLLREGKSGDKMRGMTALMAYGSMSENQILNLCRDQNPTNRYYAYVLLGEIFQDKYLDKFVRAIDDPSAEVYLSVGGILRALHSPESNRAFFKAIEDPDPETKLRLIRLAEMHKMKFLLPSIRNLLNDPKSLIREKTTALLWFWREIPFWP